MFAERFNTSSGAEGADISLDRTESLQALESSPALLMYETGTTGENAETVRYGLLRSVRPAGQHVTFRFYQEGRFSKATVHEFADRLGINARFEFGHTHWAIKDGSIPSTMLAKLERTGDLATNEALLLKIESFKNILLSHATGKGCDEAQYVNLRRQLLKPSRISDQLPNFVRTCRTPGEFWGFIKPKFGTYHERREFLREEFDPALSILESESRSPSDPNVAAALQRVDSDYVRETWRKALDRRSTDPEGAITAARTQLESVCKHILDETGTPYKDTEDLPKLYSLVASQLNLSPSQHSEQVFKQILGIAKASSRALAR